MLSFTRFINEAGDTARPYTYQGEKDEYGHRYHQYTFANGGRDYRVNIAHHDIPHHIAIVNFSDHTDHGDSFGVQTITNRAKHSAVRVMSTVHNIVKHHLSKHPEIEEVHFSSNPDEPSRGRLYAKYTEKHGGITDPTAYDTDHVIPARSYRMTNESEEPVRVHLGKPKGERAQKLMADFTNDSDEHPFNPAARILHGAVVHASRDGHQVHIHDIQTTDPKSGAGTKALKHLTSLADKHSVKLNLFAKAYSNRPEHIRSTPRLIKWYEKHGFKHDEQDYDPDYGSEMTYYPK